MSTVYLLIKYTFLPFLKGDFLFLQQTTKPSGSNGTQRSRKNDEEATNPNLRLEISAGRKKFNRIVSIATLTRILSNGNW